MAQISDVKEHMQVLGSDGAEVGVVDRAEGNRIKLTKTDSADGQHHFIEADLIDRVDAHVHLNQAARDVIASWDDEIELEDDETEIEEAPGLRDKEWTERRR